MELPACYIYKRTSDKGRELRYSMRSLCHVKNWNGEVYVAGDKEDWMSGRVQLVDGFTRSAVKYQDARNRLRAIVKDKRVADDFIFMNDDFFVTEPTEIKPLYDGTLVKDAGTNEWQQSNVRTRAYLEARGIKDPKNYSIHVPIVFNKEKLAAVLDIIDEHPLQTMSVRSLYGNLHKIGGTQYKDRKTYGTTLDKAVLVSTRTYSADLERLFPEKSEFEL